MLKRSLSLCVALSVFAGMAAGQSGPSPSFSFIDRWGDDAPQVVEYDFTRVRLTDPSLDVSGQRDTVDVTVSSVLGTDTETVILTETGKRTGVFEGGIDLRMNGGSPAFPGILETFGSSGSFDSIQVDGPGGLSDTAQVVPSILRLVDDQGDEVAAFAAGGRVFVRLIDRLSDTPNPDTTIVTLTTSSGDSEVVILAETAVSGGEFTGSIASRLATGAPTPGDGVLDTLAGETLTASHDDINNVTSSSDTAPFAGATLRFVDSRGVPTTTALEGAKLTLQAISASANFYPAFPDEIYATLTSQLGGDVETLTLVETGASTGVFEGRMRMATFASVSQGDGQLQISLSNPGQDVIEANASGAAPVTIFPAGSSMRLLDAWGNDVESVPQGGTLRVRIEDHWGENPPSGLHVRDVRFRSLTTNDEEFLMVTETEVGSYVFEGTISLENTPAVPGDGKLQAQEEGEILEAWHPHYNNVTSSEDTARLSLSELWFLDEDSREPTETVLENYRVSFRLFDALLSTPGSADIFSQNAEDSETVPLAPYLGRPGVFEGWIPTEVQPYSVFSGDGVLGTRTDVNSLDGFETITVSTGSPAASATARAVFSEVRFVDAHGNEVESYALGEPVRVRLRSGNPGTPATDQVQITLLSLFTGDQAFITLNETGPDTNVYEGAHPTATGTASFGDGLLQVRTGETIVAEDNRAYWPVSFTMDRATITASRVTFVDRQNAPTGVVFRNGEARLEAFDRAANGNVDVIESVQVTVRSYSERNGRVVDTETVTLEETGPDTALFRGSIPLASSLTGSANGLLETSFFPPNEGPDTLRAELGGVSGTARLTDATLRFIDSEGNDSSLYEAGDMIRVRLYREASNESPFEAETDVIYITSWEGPVDSAPSRDSVTVLVTETGPDTGVFEGEVQSIDAPASSDPLFQVAPGGEIEAEYLGSWTEDVDRALIAGAPNQPPVAEDDTVTTPEDTPVTINLLANDSDPEGQPLTITRIIPYGSGGLQTNPDGTRTYIPSPNYHGGPELFIYEVSDGSLTDFGALQVFITPVNDGPVAGNDSVTTAEDSSVQINVLANDVDADGDTLSILSFAQGTKGSVSASGGGLLYTPNPNANGVDSFMYTVQDPSGATALGTISVTITAVNDLPVANADNITLPEDTPLAFPLLANDTDVDGDTLTISSVTQGSRGQVIPFSTIAFYGPSANWSGTDTFTYTVSDGKGGTATATVFVTVTPVNDVPTTVNDSATTAEDTPVTVNVLANDSDVEGNPLTVVSATNGFKGTVTVNAGATVTYTPNLNATGGDDFTYTVSDGTGTKTAIVWITINPVNDPPNALSDARTTPEDTAINIAILANDSDPEGQTLTVTAVTQGTNGSVVLNADKTVTYTPNFNFAGTDLFTYTISDGTLTATANVSVTMTAANDPPYAVDDGITVAEDETVSFYVLSNDSDPEGDTIYVASVLPATHGVVSGPGQNFVLTYTPKPNFHGEDFFVYKVRDLSFGENSATVMITVTPVDDDPVAVADAATVAEDAAATALNVLANDTDVDGGALKSIDSVTQPANGTVVITGGGTGLTYQPNANYCNNPPGTTLDTFTYTLAPGGSTATVTVTVTCSDDAPTAVDDAATVNEDSGANTINVQANDTDTDGGTNTISSVTQPANGTVVITNGGADLTYTPNANFCSATPDVFTYTLSPGSSSATVSVMVTCVDDPPVAVDDSPTVNEDSGANAIDVLANDTDADGGPKSVSAVTQPANGTVVITGGGTGLTYQPNANFCTTGPADTFTYTLSPGGSSTTVPVTVICVDDPAAAVADAATVTEDSAANAINVQANDTDVDGGTNTVSSVTQPANGTVAITNGGADLTYTPNANFCDTPDIFTYTLSPGGSTATVTVTVTCVDDSPVAVMDAATVNEDSGGSSINVLANDTDLDAGPISITAVTQPANGTVVITNGGADLTYAPNANFCGTPDPFNYSLSPGGSTATVTITVTCVNDAPIVDLDANDDQGTAGNDFAVTFTEGETAKLIEDPLDATLTDVDSATLVSLTVTITNLLDLGSETLSSDVTGTSITADYVPATGVLTLTGPDTLANFQTVLRKVTYLNTDLDSDATPRVIHFVANDGSADGNTAASTVTVVPVDTPPTAVDDATTVNEDSAANAIDVLANDTDPDGGPISISAVTQPANGTVVITGGGTGLTYQPNANFCGTLDTFTYTLTPGGSTATVTVSVTCVDDNPVAVADAATVVEDSGANTINVLANDTDVDGGPISITSVTQPANGTVTITGGGTGLTYTPNANFCNTPETFTYTLSPGGSTATVAVTVTCVDDNPVAVADAATVVEDSGANAINVLANDTDVDGGPISITSVTQPANGTVVITGGGTGLTYQPNANFCGTPNTFTYTLAPGGSTATVTVTVTCTNDAPDAVNDVAATAEDTVVTLSVLANDTDVDGNPLQVTAVTQGTKGAVTINANNTVTYTPALNTNGADAFTYTISDGNGGSDTATVTVSVAAVNDAPVAAADTATTREGAAVTVSVLANDSDVEGNTLTVTSVTTPAEGTAAVNGNNTVTYTPDANFNGTDSFTYTVSDGQGGTATATVTVTVTDALERVAVLATHGVWIQTGADVLSGDVIVNQTGSAPFLTGSVELTVAGTVTTPAGYDVQANRINVAAGATVASDVFYNQLTGTVTGPQNSPLALPVFATLPSFLTATPGATDVNVGTNGTRTLAAGSYRDLIVGRKGTVTFTGGTYHFRTVQIDREARLFFSAASTVRVQQKLTALQTTWIRPAAGATIDGSDIVIHVGGGNGTGGGLTETPKAVELGVDNVIWANVYAPNGTIWMKDRTQVRGVLLGKDVQLGPDVQVTLDSSFTGQ